MKSTKKALLSSVLCIMLCLSMLVGTTFAWFTDTVSTGANRIQSGILKIDMEHKVGREWVSLKENPEHEIISSDILWEPGYTAVSTVRIVNKGNLALKYKLNMSFDKNADKELAKVIDVYTLVGELGEGRPDLSDETVWNKVGSLSELITMTGGTANGILLPDGATPKRNNEVVGATEVTFVLHMREEAGNEYQNLNLGAVFMNLYATQYTFEEDSFDDQYDADAELYDHYVMTFADLRDAFAAGGSILVLNDIEWEHRLYVEPGKEIYLDMNGMTMTACDAMADDLFIYSKIGSKITIDGNGTFDLEDYTGLTFMFPCGDVVIENGNYIRNRIPEGTPVGQVGNLFIGVKWSEGIGDTVINGGYFDSGYYDANADLVFSETEDDIAKRGNSNDKNAVRVAIKSNISKTLNKSANKFIVYGGTFVGMNPAWGDEGSMLPTTPNYLRPWSYYQGEFLDGQVTYNDKVELPEGYSITESAHTDGRPVYTVSYSN